MIKVGTKVIIKDTEGTENEIWGCIVGYAILPDLDSMGNHYVVELDKGFYSPDKETFIKRMLVHSDNILIKFAYRVYPNHGINSYINAENKAEALYFIQYNLGHKNTSSIEVWPVECL